MSSDSTTVSDGLEKVLDGLGLDVEGEVEVSLHIDDVRKSRVLGVPRVLPEHKPEIVIKDRPQQNRRYVAVSGSRVEKSSDTLAIVAMKEVSGSGGRRARL